MRRCLLIVLAAGMLMWLPASIAAQDTNTGVTIHVVQRGETLFRIARQYGLTVNDLARLNSITDLNTIQVGQRLLVPTKSSVVSQPQTHVVQPGETLQSIAQLYGLTAEQLASRNNIPNVNRIYVGQVLNITSPQATVAPNPTATIQPTGVEQQAVLTNTIYAVQRGDTLFRIATRYGLTVNDLVRANNISDPTTIYAGQQLLIPSVSAPQLALDLPPEVSGLDVMPIILVEGQTGRIHLTTLTPMNVGGTFLGRVIGDAVEQNNTSHTILVGIPIFTDAGVYPLTLKLSDGNGKQIPLTVNVQVAGGNYGKEYITLSSDELGLLDPTLEASEQSVLQGIMGVFTPKRYFDGPMGLPAAANMTSPFGRRRSYNGGPFDHFHSGTDFAGAPGTPILASAAGQVVFAGSLSVRGNATIIDHGWGVFTGYWHQTQQYVKVGDFVNAGQVIGTIGSTGRVTGPHLHWELWVNGVPVDPMQWVRQSFS
jgi:murein DD-endopeptidase MepM/ murein hydrolase activator NlpD